MATVMLTPFAVYAPNSGKDSTLSITVGVNGSKKGYGVGGTDSGSKGSDAGYVPSNISALYYDGASGSEKIIIETSDDKWPDLWPLDSIDITQGSDTTNHDVIFNTAEKQWESTGSVTSSELATASSTDSITVKFNYFWVADRFADIRMNNTGIASL